MAGSFPEDVRQLAFGDVTEPNDAGPDDAASNEGGASKAAADDQRPRVTLYEAVGGVDYFFALVGAFYDGVADDPILRPLYPEDLDDSIRHTALFLAQYWGGPTTYSDERGHPRLRMRHFPFAIGEPERDAWVRHMLAALEATPLPEMIGAAAVDEVRSMQRNYFEQAATAMINQP